MNTLSQKHGKNTLQGYPGRYNLVVGDSTPSNRSLEKGGAQFMSDDGSSRLREEQIDTESAEPPSLTRSSLLIR